jgi:hypothetical protein
LVAAKFILGGLALVFLVIGAARRGVSNGQSRTWLLIGIIFGVVSAWLFYQG